MVATQGFRPDKLGDVLEAAYRLDVDDQSWLAGVATACRAVYGRPGPTHAHIYDASNVAHFRPLVFHAEGFCERGTELIPRGREFLTPAMVARTYRVEPAAMLTTLGLPEMAPLLEELSRLGILDAFNINGLDPSGIGAHVSLWVGDHPEPSSEEIGVYRRLAHHLGAAHRYRRRLKEAGVELGTHDLTDGAEAILDAGGRVVHATGAATEREARAELVDTAKGRDKALAGKCAADQALRQWPALTSARWSLVDRFERNGVRYVVARENQVSVRGITSLTERERQVVAYLAIGHSTKEIAYALGIQDATVRVLIARAAAKLGVRSRVALLNHAEVRPLRPLVPDSN